MAPTCYKDLVVFDLDGTLLRGRSVCEVIAESLGHLARMQELERMMDRQQWSAAREEMAYWYRGVPMARILDALRNVQFAPGVTSGISLLRAHGFAIGIASITWRFAVEHLAEQWGIEHCLATALEESGVIDHVWPEHKAQWVLNLATRLGIELERTAAVGDSAGDSGMLDAVGTPIFVGAELPSGPRRWIHLPHADIEHIAYHLIEASARRSVSSS